jgi:hypothetical protein
MVQYNTVGLQVPQSRPEPYSWGLCVTQTHPHAFNIIILPEKRKKKKYPYSWTEILSVQLHSDGLLQLLSASRCTCPCVFSVHPLMLNIIFEGGKKKYTC